MIRRRSWRRCGRLVRQQEDGQVGTLHVEPPSAWFVWVADETESRCDEFAFLMRKLGLRFRRRNPLWMATEWVRPWPLWLVVRTVDKLYRTLGRTLWSCSGGPPS